MHIVHVQIQVKREYLEPFLSATLDNARNSVKEPGVARFDVIQRADAPEQVMLLEVYRTPEDQVAHRQTAHYARWRDAVADMMAAPRTAVVYGNIFPGEEGWD